MSATLLELLPIVAELLAYGLGSLVLSAVGLYVEDIAVATISSGQVKLGAWMAIVGAVALYMSYLLLTDKVSTTATRLRTELRQSPSDGQ